MSIIKKLLSIFGIGVSNGQSQQNGNLDLLQRVREQRAGNFPKITNWVVDNYHTSVKFRVLHMGITEVVGKFKEFQAEFKGSSPDFTSMEIIASVNINSVETDMLARDAHLKSPDFFDTEKYPFIEFRSTSVQWRPFRSFKLNGNLTIKGITKPISLEGKIVNFLPKDTFGQPRIGFEINGAINRKDFGLLWQVELESGDKVVDEIIKIEIHAEIATKESIEAMNNYLKQMAG
jgi:polyisoprenoid-binding protein YceI